MWLLAVDTTTKSASVALLHDTHLVALVAPQTDEQHSVQVFRNIQEAVKEGGIGLRDIDVYAVANGPGAFTALRVGLTVVKGLAEVYQKPVVPVSVLEAVCESARAEGLLVPIVNAYRGQVFGAVYEKVGGAIDRYRREWVLTPEDFFQNLIFEDVSAKRCTLVGPELENYAEKIQSSAFASSGREVTSPVLADAVARRGVWKFAHGEATDALHLEANYVRRSDAELLWKGP
jgi:tRNA threonylcarbamoyladenosine biosynthesis protein TsaB